MFFKGQYVDALVAASTIEERYSGVHIFTDLYLALFSVLLSTFAVAFFLWFDTDVSFNDEYFKKDAED